MSNNIINNNYNYTNGKGKSDGKPILNTDVHLSNNNVFSNVQTIKPSTPAETGWRDMPFGILFIINCISIITLMVVYGIPILQDSIETNKKGNQFFSSDDTKNFLVGAIGLCIVASILSLGGLQILMKYPRQIIIMGLGFSILMSLIILVVGLLNNQIPLSIFAAIIFMFTLCYAYYVRSRIPFASANLKVGCSGVKKHKSLIGVSFTFVLISIVWNISWVLAAVGVVDEFLINEAENGKQELKEGFGTYIGIFFLILSFYWGSEVLKNIVHTTIAGTISTWWFNSESAGATMQSLKRSCTTSLGSIALGSLLVAILETLEYFARQAQENGDVLACIATCILGCLRSLLEYFNRWAYVYVGIYGYKFTDAAKSVIKLFKARGWTGIISDDLVGNALTIIAFGIGLLCAGLGAALSEIVYDNGKDSNIWVFIIIGFLSGFFIASITLSVIASSVLTVFVCFAEDPIIFSQNHPNLYNELSTAWYNLYPEIMSQSGYNV